MNDADANDPALDAAFDGLRAAYRGLKRRPGGAEAAIARLRAHQQQLADEQLDWVAAAGPSDPNPLPDEDDPLKPKT